MSFPVSSRLLLAASASVFMIGSAQAENLFSDVSLGVGGFVSIAPVYEGSDEYQVRGAPFAFPVFNRGFTDERARLAFYGLDDVRFAAFRSGGLDLGPVVGYRFGRDEDVADNLEGLGDVDGGLVLGGFASYTMGMAFVEGAVSSQVTGDDDHGFIFDIGAGVDTDLTRRVNLRTEVSAEYATDDYMDRNFSVTNAQARSSAAGYNAFDADGGIKNVAFDTSLTFQATERFSVRGSIGYSRLVGDAADSPLSVDDNQFSGGVGFSYQF